MNKQALKDFSSAFSSILVRVVGLPSLASFGLHVLLLSWILFNDSARWAHIDWNDVIPCLVLVFLAFTRSSRGAL